MESIPEEDKKSAPGGSGDSLTRPTLTRQEFLERIQILVKEIEAFPETSLFTRTKLGNRIVVDLNGSWLGLVEIRDLLVHRY